MKSIIRESYISLKNRLGRVPYLLDFYENGETDPLLIIREYKTYQNFLVSVENELLYRKDNRTGNDYIRVFVENDIEWNKAI